MIFKPAAKEELRRAVEWYVAIRIELGLQFKSAVADALAQVVQFPLRFPIVLGTIRECVIDGFPYSIFYRSRSGRITVLAVYHHSRAPLGWLNR